MKIASAEFHLRDYSPPLRFPLLQLREYGEYPPCPPPLLTLSAPLFVSLDGRCAFHESRLADPRSLEIGGGEFRGRHCATGRPVLDARVIARRTVNPFAINETLYIPDFTGNL